MLATIKKIYPYLKSSGLYFFSSLFTALIGIVLNPIYALNLTHEDYAIIGYYSSFNLLFIPLLHFCLMSYYARQYYFIKEEERENFGNTILLSIIGIGAIAFVVFTFAFYLLHQDMSIEFPFFPYAILTYLQLYIGNITTFYLTKLRISRNAKKFAAISIIQCFVTTALTLILVVYYKLGAEGKLLGALIATVLLSIYSLCKSITSIHVDWKILKGGLKFCWPLVLSALLWYFLTGVDRVFLEELGDVKQFGLYSVGLSIAGYMQIFYTTLNNTFQPDIYQAIAQKRKKKLLGIMAVIISSVTLANITFILLAPFIIGLLTANRYVDASPFAQILSLHNITMACYYMVVNVIVGYGYTKQEFCIRIFGALTSVFCFKILIDHWQFYGAAWGQVLSFLFMSLYGMIFLLVKRNIDRRKINL